ncbi:hypothetical protein ACOSP7_025453 [Xanthoceras sorbifolium]
MVFLIRDELMNELVEHNILTFPAIVRLQKSLVARHVEAKSSDSVLVEANGKAKNPSWVLTKINADNNPS